MKNMLKLYAEGCIVVILGDGPLGFEVKETESGNVVISKFTQAPDSIYYPIYYANCVDVGYYVTSINEVNVCTMNKEGVNDELKKAKRPLTLVFGKPKTRGVNSLFTDLGITREKLWESSDNYLPMREYDLQINEISPLFIDRHNLTLKQRAVTPFYEGGPLFLCDVREYAYNGISDSNTRSTIWKMLLKSLPFNPSKWSEMSSNNLMMYNEFIDEFIIQQNKKCKKEDCCLVPSPIDVSWKLQPDYKPEDTNEDTNESIWSRSFGDMEMREIIWKDTERTYSDITFFRMNKPVLARILFIYGKLNHGVEYVQGMNELLAPIMYAFGEATDASMMNQISREVEADTFFAFNSLMSETRDLFIKQMDHTTSGLQGVLHQLSTYLSLHTPHTSSHLKSLGLEPEYYAVRWMMTFFAREFPLHDTMRIWDSLLSDPKRFMLIFCLGTALVIHCNDALIAGDFSLDIQLLQNYVMPSTDRVLVLMNDVRLKHLSRSYGHNEISTRIMKAGGEIVDQVNIQVKKGVSVMKTKGIPFLSRLAHSTMNVMTSVGKGVINEVNRTISGYRESKQVDSDSESISELSDDESSDS